ncbi:MAG: hypothetical protein A2Y62_12055 [Candidatus Fischerbacteria bacterium RBG_13_37_8]|uniref:PABS domain-containing protein n=1 Tax=Candidatus Fischerbacteria bacterium RBG_13_37_8 TaxID=1817863 RepID=A0A1F5VDB1_9BACT|nr:MAG: hypothetical protein A2Y62_12055 [Candidatus Fischerbacteria bacterium RBG_13_37_8]
MKKKYAAIFLIAAATLLLEVTLTRVFSVIFFSNYAFLIVSSALFGYGISAVWLSLRKQISNEFADALLQASGFFFAASIIFLLVVICYLPFDFESGKLSENIKYFFLYYLAVILPFIFSGAFISLLFMQHSEKSNTLYFWDLFGASLGSLLIFILIKRVGGDGLFWICCILSLSAILFVSKRTVVRLASVLLIAIVGLLSYFYNEQFEIRPHITKRIFSYYYETNKIDYTEWSSLTRIDVAKNYPNWIIWIDCGSNQSFMPHLKKGEVIKQKAPKNFRPLIYNLPYYVRTEAKTLIIGFGGGMELSFASLLGASEIVGVEMDPAIIDIVLNRYKEETGVIFQDKKFRIHNDEGRSFLKASKEKFDIIQQVHNATPIAVASGALNISETFLMTTEAFSDYLDKLTDNGMLSLYRDGVERIFPLALEVLSKRGSHYPYKHIAVVSIVDYPGIADLFMMKKTPFTHEEIETIKKLCKRFKWNIFYLPDEPNKYKHFVPFLTLASIREVQKKSGVYLDPPTDSKPFFKRWLPLWSSTIKDPSYFAPEAVKMIEATSKKIKYIFLIILIEGAIMAVFFIFIPLMKFTKFRMLVNNKSVLGYFAGLGLGFILLEIVYMQKFILYLGHPSYSITFILFSLLLSAGAGSFLSGYFAEKHGFRKILRIAFPAIIIIILLSTMLLGVLMEHTIQFPSMVKFCISFLFICVLGLFLGMPFPAGVHLVGLKEKSLVAWAWGINSYATVLGSVFALILAITFNFHVVMIVAALCYCMSFLVSSRLSRMESP